MRRSRNQKAETHDALIESASRLFREKGIEATSVGEVMAEAGLTHGGFYRHFANKDALAAEAIGHIFDGILADIEGQTEKPGQQQAVAEYLKFYLSKEHLLHPAFGCPIPTLAAEMARSPAPLRQAFGDNVNRTLDAIALGMKGDPNSARNAAMRELAMRVGAILIARACDEGTASQLLKACQS
jgi:TetR/AcrR family transcriptional repressor of nem operon